MNRILLSLVRFRALEVSVYLLAGRSAPLLLEELADVCAGCTAAQCGAGVG